MEQPCGPHIEHSPSPRLRRDRKLREGKSWGQRYACRKRLRLTRLQVRDPEQTRMLPESIRAAPSDFEARRLLLQSALPGTRCLFAEVIGRLDERGHVIV
jgi:hypothetical protein